MSPARLESFHPLAHCSSRSLPGRSWFLRLQTSLMGFSNSERMLCMFYHVRCTRGRHGPPLTLLAHPREGLASQSCRSCPSILRKCHKHPAKQIPSLSSTPAAIRYSCGKLKGYNRMYTTHTLRIHIRVRFYLALGLLTRVR